MKAPPRGVSSGRSSALSPGKLDAALLARGRQLLGHAVKFDARRRRELLDRRLWSVP